MTIVDDAPLLGREGAALVDLNRLFAAGATADLSTHLRAHGAFDPRAVAPGLLRELERSGLSGRGGAGFAAWRKLEATANAAGERVFGGSAAVIANGAEGEPRSWKDAVLLHNAPHLVIDGLLAAGAALGTSRLYLYASEARLDTVRAAVAERQDARIITLVASADTFISGEASAVVNAIENHDARPRDHVRRLSESGLRKRPTLVHNVETLAHVALIARHGADWFRGAGTVRDPGTRLVTVSGDVSREGVFEIAGDMRVRDVLAAAGVDRDSVSAVLVGGYHGTWLRGNQLDLPLSAAGLAPAGAAPGAGVLIVLGRHRCGVAATADIVEYLASESARQCGPCMFGLPALAQRMSALAAGRVQRDAVGEAARLADSVTGRGACHHPDGTARLVRSALVAFADDVEAHASGRCTRAEA
ncbi:NADH-ubiquinone oxidoreductase-F iron-sulfur binding region domain-containing protein [Diaminobutyricibacter sp. McL0608]|uniref:NADH-ubiquinone oxidoreductase-F iron-sulfur binding region domain-containing protein n=1 Tax=Leifsonia sp. McL0608 TaxID=3143537 RepID=UPI0031F306B3